MVASPGRSALVVAHPGHELRVYGWLAQAMPDVCVLTDGSGHTGHSRLASSDRVLDEAGATRGPVFGRLSDRGIYAALLRGDAAMFRDLAAEIADAFVARGVTMVLGDSIEGYNPSHDICRLLIDAAVAIARARGASIHNYDFAVVGAWTSEPDVVVTLDDASFEKKMRVARGYEEMQPEIDAALARHGLASFRSERFHRRDVSAELVPSEAVPFYETHGERQVAAGYYQEVVRYREHVAPMNDAVLAALDSLACVR